MHSIYFPTNTCFLFGVLGSCVISWFLIWREKKNDLCNFGFIFLSCKTAVQTSQMLQVSLFFSFFGGWGGEENGGAQGSAVGAGVGAGALSYQGVAGSIPLL